MNSFETEFLEKQPIPHSLLRTIRLLGEYRGKEALFMQQTPQVLESLRQVAIIQSTESSNRIEGIEAPVERIKKLVEHKTTPKNRSEQEIAGYRDALATIHANHANMPYTTGLVLQLHRDLYQFVAQQGGRWKMTDNEISETRPDGTKVIRYADLAQACPNVSRPTIKRVLGQLRKEGKVECMRPGRDAIWEKKGS